MTDKEAERKRKKIVEKALLDAGYMPNRQGRVIIQITSEKTVGQVEVTAIHT